MANSPSNTSPPTKSSNGVDEATMAAVPKETLSDVYVANTTYSTDLDGAAVVIHKGRDRVRSGHPLLDQNPQYFDKVEVAVTYDVEAASAVPGEKRGQPDTGQTMTKSREDLLERARALNVAGRHGMDKDQLEAAVAKAEAKKG